MTPPDPRAQRAYQLYVEEGMPIHAIRQEVHARGETVKRWVVELGGKLRSSYPRDGNKAQVGPGKTGWRNEAKCSIGYAKKGTHSMGDSWYCSRHCDHGYCDEEATVQDLAAFARLTEEREADEKLRRERKEKKLSGRGRTLWR